VTTIKIRYTGLIIAIVDTLTTKIRYTAYRADHEVELCVTTTTTRLPSMLPTLELSRPDQDD